jgi:2-polyprenyl-6-methoxyphenol hydroxylase-like FAD-dependent oxidoreductase
MAPNAIDTRCCIVGGGPAGMMLGLLLARAGVDVVVLEKHRDFLRDFRGDTIHPSTLELMHELGLLEEFLKLPHQEARTLTGQVGDMAFTVADFSHLPTRCKFIAFMPQWDFLNFLADKARRYPTFRLLMQAEATGLIETAGAITGVRATTPDGPTEIRASLVVGCDGRHSTVRASAGLQTETIGAPMDVLWFGVSRRADDPPETMGVFRPGHIFIAINRGDNWQCGFVIAKGTIDDVHRRGLPAFRAEVAQSMPALAGRLDTIADWDQVKLLTVAVDRLERWYRRGLLCIGDAAHAMSPVGGVGINLAVQDAVAAANILAEPLRAGAVGEDLLAAVQRRREFPTRVTQRLQVIVQNNVITGALSSKATIKPPLPAKLLQRFPILRRIPARLVGMGIRPEHVRTPEVAPPSTTS